MMHDEASFAKSVDVVRCTHAARIYVPTSLSTPPPYHHQRATDDDRSHASHACMHPIHPRVRSRPRNERARHVRTSEQLEIWKCVLHPTTTSTASCCSKSNDEVHARAHAGAAAGSSARACVQQVGYVVCMYAWSVRMDGWRCIYIYLGVSVPTNLLLPNGWMALG